MSDTHYEVKREPVHNRDESGSKLFGWTFGEMGLMGGMFFGVNMLTGSTKATFAALGLTYLYIKKVKQLLPERYLSNLIQFYLRRDFLYRASGRDTHWRPPVVSRMPK